MKKKKVMVVDDEVDFLRMVKINLEYTDKYEVLTLSEPREVMSALHSFKPDILLLDILMPGLNGIEVCHKLNDDSIGSITPIIIVSALEKDEDKLRAYKAGVVDFVVKPVETDALISRIEIALKNKK